MAEVTIVFYKTSSPSTLKVRSDIEVIEQILRAKRIQYESVRSHFSSSMSRLHPLAAATPAALPPPGVAVFEHTQAYAHVPTARPWWPSEANVSCRAAGGPQHGALQAEGDDEVQ